MQKRKHSLLEALLNTATGFVVSVLVGIVVFPAFGWRPTLGENIGVTTVYTVVSVVRSYAWRRAFVWLHQNGHLK